MKKALFFTLLVISFCCVISGGMTYAADWSQYESGRNNIRLDGFQGQPGYIEFTDGSGNTAGYIWLSKDRGLVWCSADAIDLSTTKLTDAYGVPVSTAYSGGDVY